MKDWLIEMKTIEVVAAIFRSKDSFLCMQRNEGPLSYISRKFEFPGGKIEPGETKEEALERELREEMDIYISVCKDQFFMTVDYTYPDFRIIMHGYLINVDDLKFKMNDHESYRWMTRETLFELDWAPADVPIVEKLIRVS